MAISALAIWGILAGIFLVLELITVALISIWFFVGSMAAMFLAWFHFPFWLQVLAFVIVSSLTILLMLPAIKKRMGKEKTNLDSIIGQQGLVTEEINNLTNHGRVFVDGKSWAAKSANGKTISPNEIVEVVALQGVHIIVEPIQRKE